MSVGGTGELSTKRTIRAIHESDLEQFLESVNLLEKARQGELKCADCGEKLVLKEIARIRVHESGISVYCYRETCDNSGGG